MIEILKKQWFVVLVAVIFIGFAIYCVYDTNKGKLPGKTASGKDVVATMEDYTLTADDLYTDLYDNYQGVNSLYNKFQNLVADKAIKTTDEIKESAKEIKANIQANAQSQASSSSSYGTAEDIIANFLTYYGFDADDLDGYSLISAKTKQLRDDYYAANLDTLFTPIYNEKKPRVVSHILIKVADFDNITEEEQAKLDAVDKAIADGTSFAEIAKQYSDDTGSKENGGYLGYVDTDTSFVESFMDQTMKMSAGEMSGWVKEDGSYKGFHKILVSETDKDALEKDEAILDDIYSAIDKQNTTIAYTYMWEAAKKLDITFGSDEIKQQLMDYMGIKE